MNRGDQSKRCRIHFELDRLSNLPEDVRHQILCRLPIREAARTCVLSSRWRFTWSEMPDLVFDAEFFSLFPTLDLFGMVDQALLRHRGRISKFMLQLSSYNLITNNEIDRWILYLSYCSVTKLILECPHYSLHSFVLSFQNLVHLELKGCLIKISSLGGLQKLKTLIIRNVMAPLNAIENFISSCPILEYLMLDQVTSIQTLNIDAPNLRIFVFDGRLLGIDRINSSNLEEVSICTQNVDVPAAWLRSYRTFCAALHRIRRLAIRGSFLKYLAVGNRSGPRTNQWCELIRLEICIAINEQAESAAALWFLRSCPNIEQLIIRADDSGNRSLSSFWKGQHENCSFKNLRILRFDDFSGRDDSSEVVHFMIMASPALHKIEIKPIKPFSEFQILKWTAQWLIFGQVQPKLEVVFLQTPYCCISLGFGFRFLCY